MQLAASPAFIASRPSRQPARPVRCGAGKASKQLAKRLDAQKQEADRILLQLRAGAAVASPQSLADIVQAIQRVGAEVEELAGAVDGMSSCSSSSSSSSSSDDEACGTMAPEAVAAIDSREPETAAQQPVELPTDLAGLPVGAERLWPATVGALGPELTGQVLVCTGKACSRAGSAAVLKAYSALAQQQPGLQVGACKCVDACKQGPNLRVVRADGAKATLTSRDKPPKRQKAKPIGNIVSVPRPDAAAVC